MEAGKRYVTKCEITMGVWKHEFSYERWGTTYSGKRLPVGTEFTLVSLYFEPPGSDSVPERLIRLDDGSEGSIGRGITVEDGHLAACERAS